MRPKVIASTATIRNAATQVHRLFLRRVAVFPPHGLDIADNFFSVQREPCDKTPGRRYLGICAQGRRLKAALIRVYVAFLCAAQRLYNDPQISKAADPWMTVVGYFNSMRELGGMRRLVDDDVQVRCKKMERRGLATRLFDTDSLAELTSRMRSQDIPAILDRLEAPFDPELQARRKKLVKERRFTEARKKPVDVLLATNMISVGVDVKRLGLMIAAGQPKATAEYIQATSRVGREKPGLVCTVYNWARPRDLSHYERFEHYHGTFYQHVEPLSVTPFSAGALQRGLAGLLVALVRMGRLDMNANNAAARVAGNDPVIADIIEAVAQRAELLGRRHVGDLVRQELKDKLNYWLAQAQDTTGGKTLTYAHTCSSKGTAVSLMKHSDGRRWQDFTCLDSLGDVEPAVRLVVEDGGLDELADGTIVANRNAGSEGTA